MRLRSSLISEKSAEWLLSCKKQLILYQKNLDLQCFSKNFRINMKRFEMNRSQILIIFLVSVERKCSQTFCFEQKILIFSSSIGACCWFTVFNKFVIVILFCFFCEKINFFRAKLAHFYCGKMSLGEIKLSNIHIAIFLEWKTHNWLNEYQFHSYKKAE